MSAYIAIAASLLFTAYATLWNSGPYGFPYHNYMIGVIGHIIVFGGGYLASFLFPNRDTESRELTLWGWLQKRHSVREPQESPAFK
jgi:SSS family solute:Na+ symporter